MMYYYRRRTSKLKWLILLPIIVAVGIFIYWFYLSFYRMDVYGIPIMKKLGRLG